MILVWQVEARISETVIFFNLKNEDLYKKKDPGNAHLAIYSTLL
jgi:hypothetical protein